jgi:hypothetical protein
MRQVCFSTRMTVFVATAMVVVGCYSPTPTPRTTPIPPSNLETLPRNASMKCNSSIPHPERTLITLWELPGLEPGPKSSQGGGVRGRDIAYVPECTPIRMMRFAWSEADNEFYIFVQAPQGEGWVRLYFINLEP